MCQKLELCVTYETAFLDSETRLLLYARNVYRLYYLLCDGLMGFVAFV